MLAANAATSASNQASATTVGSLFGLTSPPQSADMTIPIEAAPESFRPQTSILHSTNEMLVSPQPDTSQNDTVDGMVVITFADEAATSCFGPSSNSALLSHINDTIRQMTTGNARWDRDEDSRRPQSAHFSRPVSPSPYSGQACPLDPSIEDVNCFILPTKEKILKMLDSFFTGFGVLFPYLYKKSFLDGLADMETASFRGVRRPWLCLLNTIMAFASSGAVYSHRGQNRADAEIFLQRALKVLPHISLQSANLEAVQASLLVLQYLQGTQRSALTWTLQGFTIHAAMQIGLHSPSENAKYSPLEREMRKRCWHMCCIMDKTCSMTFGRPQIIKQDCQLVDLPQDTDFEALDSETQSTHAALSTGGLSTIAAFNQSIKLYGLVGIILDTVYQNNIQTDDTTGSAKVFHKIMAIEPTLAAWHAELPAQIQLQTKEMCHILDPTSEPLIDMTLNMVLTLRYLHTRMLLHRQMIVCFLRYGSPGNNSSGEWHFLMNFGKASLEMCLRSALETLDVLGNSANTAALPPMLTTWWFQIYYGRFLHNCITMRSSDISVKAFSAALVVFAVMTISLKHDITILHLERPDFIKRIQDASKTIKEINCDSRIGN
ncbi:hypothetical protein LTR13_003021 [Exophiala sideris]|nr:hypothetical protein LTR13_003021 [Exophiala sideris]